MVFNQTKIIRFRIYMSSVFQKALKGANVVWQRNPRRTKSNNTNGKRTS